MYVGRVLSLNNGWSILTTQKPEEWAEATAILSLFSNKRLLTAIERAERVEEKATNKRSGFIVFYLHRLYNGLLNNIAKWHDTLPEVNSQIVAPVEPQYIKSGVSASIVGINELTGGDFLTNLCLTIPLHYSAGTIDVAVIFIPTTKTIDYLLELGAKPNHLTSIPTEESCRKELIKLSIITSKAPVVLAFVSPTESEEVSIEEFILPETISPTIERTIEFAPEFYQAGVGLLSYFGEVLRQKDPSTKAKIRIEQDGQIVRLHIESSAGEIETIEKELDQYALVISNQAPPETLFEQRMHIMQLESRLEVAKVEIKNAHDLKQLTEGFYGQQVRSLQQQIDSLTQQVATGLLQQDKVFNLMHQQTGSHERMQAALLMHGQLLFKDLLEESRSNSQLLTAIQNLHNNLLSGLTTLDVEDQIKQALETVKQQKPGMLARIYSQVEGAAMKAGAGATLTWAADVVKHAIKEN